MPVRKTIMLFALLGNLFSIPTWAQAARAELGSIHSPRQIGLTYMKTGEEGEPWTLCRLAADIWDVMRGKCATPGIKFQYNVCYPLKSWTSVNGTCIDLVAGPGTTAGLVRDRGTEKFQAMMGLCGMIGAYHHFAGGVAIGLDLTGELAICARGREFGNTRLSFYDKGILHSIIPEISITYQFR